MSRLTIQHVPESYPPQFRLRREQDGKTTDPVEIPSPYRRQVGQGDRSLMDELRWYLENFLEYPFDPWTDRADRTLGALEDWGTEAFDALFGGGDGQVWLDRARRGGDVQIAVSADDPHVLSWPWEGLYDPRRGWLVHQHAVTCRLNDVDDPPPLPDLPDDRVNVLLVTARPLDEDAPYRSIARPLVETVKEQDLPASITVLRPPTFDTLREHLRENPSHYHVVHFDGHGGYLEEIGTVSGDRHRLRGPQGHLVFETAGDFDPDPIPADRLSQLLREHNIPAAVLNACQSGMVDDAADDAYASVAASLLRAGVRSVVAMSHAVMVSGAQEFVPPFYGRLFGTGSLAEAARAGRREMLAHPERVCARGRFPLQDWLGGPAHVQRHTLGGLQGEERWRFCEEIVNDLPGVTLDREDDALKELMDTLRGHPLAMRVVLPRLADRSPEDLEETVRHNLEELNPTDDEVRDRLYATLGLVDDVLDDELRELLIPLRLHGRFVETNPVEDMANQAGSSLTREQIEQGAEKLSDIGLLHNAGNGVYAVHPALTGYLRAHSSVHVGSKQVEEWEKAFVHVVTGGAVHFVRQPPHMQRTFVARHQSNIVHAKRLADRHGRVEAKQHLVEFLAVVAQNRQSHEVAYRRYRELLTIRESLNDETGIAKAYHQLGIAAQGLGNLEEAVKWLRRSAEIDDDQQGLAKTYHLLGRIAQEQGNLEKAEQRLRKSAEITEQLDDEYGVASAYHGLGIVAQERGELEEAKQWYQSSAEIVEGLNDDYRAGATYHQLGRIAQEQGSLEKAEHWLRKSVEIDERLDNEPGVAKTYHMLGIVAHEQGRQQEAEQWYDKSAKIYEKLGRESELARTQVQRGNIARDRGNLRKAGQWLLRGIQGLRSANDTISIQKAGVLFVRMFDDASADVKEDLRQHWIDAGLSEEQLDDALDQFE